MFTLPVPTMELAQSMARTLAPAFPAAVAAMTPEAPRPTTRISVSNVSDMTRFSLLVFWLSCEVEHPANPMMPAAKATDALVPKKARRLISFVIFAPFLGFKLSFCNQGPSHQKPHAPSPSKLFALRKIRPPIFGGFRFWRRSLCE